MHLVRVRAHKVNFVYIHLLLVFFFFHLLVGRTYVCVHDTQNQNRYTHTRTGGSCCWRRWRYYGIVWRCSFGCLVMTASHTTLHMLFHSLVTLTLYINAVHILCVNVVYISFMPNIVVCILFIHNFSAMPMLLLVALPLAIRMNFPFLKIEIVICV